MDLRDDTHTQVEDIIKTMRILADQPPKSEMVHAEITRWLRQAATMLEVFILPTIPDGAPLLDLRTGKEGNAHRIAPYEVVGSTTPEAAEEDAAIEAHNEKAEAANTFMTPGLPARPNGRASVG